MKWQKSVYEVDFLVLSTPEAAEKFLVLID
jgi:hypothetical protein